MSGSSSRRSAPTTDDDDGRGDRSADARDRTTSPSFCGRRLRRRRRGRVCIPRPFRRDDDEGCRAVVRSRCGGGRCGRFDEYNYTYNYSRLRAFAFTFHRGAMTASAALGVFFTPPRDARAATTTIRRGATTTATRAVSSPSPSDVAMGDGWDARHGAILGVDTPDTIALVTAADLVAPRPCELVPELPMYLVNRGDDILELWERVESFVAASASSDSSSDSSDASSSVSSSSRPELHPPYFAVPWAGGQGVARYVLDNPECVAGKRVLDVGSGCGVAALAAAAAGAAEVTANDVDPLASVAFRANARLCGLSGASSFHTTDWSPYDRVRVVNAVSEGLSTPHDSSRVCRLSTPPRRRFIERRNDPRPSSDGPCVLRTSWENLLLRDPSVDSLIASFDVVMAGDVCFVKGLSDAFQAWLGAAAAAAASASGAFYYTNVFHP